MDPYWTAIAWSVLPTIAVLTIFAFVIRSIVKMDRTERSAYARIEAEERAARGLPPKTS